MSDDAVEFPKVPTDFEVQFVFMGHDIGENPVAHDADQPVRVVASHRSSFLPWSRPAPSSSGGVTPHDRVRAGRLNANASLGRCGPAAQHPTRRTIPRHGHGRSRRTWSR